jgi:hypothetical protein
MDGFATVFPFERPIQVATVSFELKPKAEKLIVLPVAVPLLPPAFGVGFEIGD